MEANKAYVKDYVNKRTEILSSAHKMIIKEN